MTSIKKSVPVTIKKTPVPKKKQDALEIIPKGYKAFLEDLKIQIRMSQIKAALKVNAELLGLYWRIGNELSRREANEGWGAKVIDRLAKDLNSSLPGVKGFSKRNLLYMRQFADAYKDFEFAQQTVAQIPWGHNLILLERLKDKLQRLWYAQQTIEHGWSRNTLEDRIRSDLYRRQGKAVTNFQATLPKPHSGLAEQSVKDPYIFDFITLSEEAKEKDIERELLNHVQKFLIELGKGFAFVGRQVPLRMDDADYYIDLLFFHYKLNCFVVVELKNTAFKPEYAGKMAFYLAIVDKCLKEETHNRTIGMILCKNKDRFTVEYALKYNSSPIGVSSYETELIEKLPKNLKSSLPTIEEIEAELKKETK